MITDALQNLDRYRGLHKNFDTAIDFLKSTDLEKLPDGRTVVDGDHVTETDFGLVDGTAFSAGTLGDGRFALFLPEEFHKPSCINGTCTHVRKAVVKIEM